MDGLKGNADSFSENIYYLWHLKVRYVNMYNSPAAGIQIEICDEHLRSQDIKLRFSLKTKHEELVLSTFTLIFEFSEWRQLTSEVQSFSILELEK